MPRLYIQMCTMKWQKKFLWGMDQVFGRSFYFYYILAVPGHALLWLNKVKWKRNREKAHFYEQFNVTIFVNMQYFLNNYLENEEDMKLQDAKSVLATEHPPVTIPFHNTC